MKKLYFIKEKTGKWNFALVVNGKQILESIKNGYKRQNYSRKIDCVKVAGNNLLWVMDEFEITRQEFNKLFKK